MSVAPFVAPQDGRLVVWRPALLLALLAVAAGLAFCLRPSRMETQWQHLWSAVQALRTSSAYRLWETADMNGQPYLANQGYVYDQPRRSAFRMTFSRPPLADLELTAYAADDAFFLQPAGGDWVRVPGNHPAAYELVTLQSPLTMPQAVLRAARSVRRQGPGARPDTVRYRVETDWALAGHVHNLELAGVTNGGVYFDLAADSGRLVEVTVVGLVPQEQTVPVPFQYRIRFDPRAQPELWERQEPPPAALAAPELP